MQSYPINSAETIIDPLWDPSLSGLKEWKIAPGAGQGLRVWQNWCWVGFEWARRPASGVALALRRSFHVDCRAYDRVILSIMAPEGATVEITAETDRGSRVFRAPPADALKHEWAVELRGAQRLKGIGIRVMTDREGEAVGWINWVGLQNRAALERELAQWDRFDARWDRYLKPPDFKPAFQPQAGLLISAAELARLRRRHDRQVARTGMSPFLKAAQEARAVRPEAGIRDYVNFWGDTRYCRERDHGNRLLQLGPAAAVAGLLNRDGDLLRLGARYALSLGFCGHWDDGMICRLPGGVFEHRCFVQSLCLLEIALILDLAGEWFTDVGREFLMRRMAEEGLGAVRFNTWKHEYIFQCNQLAWFTPGRMMAALLLERHWPRARAETEQAYRDLIESLNRVILPDGGYVEGPSYFTCVGRSGGLPLYLYSRARRRPFKALLPRAFRKTAAFAALIASTDEQKDVIPICDARDRLDHDTLSVMSAALPRSEWVGMYRKALRRTGNFPESLLACGLEGEIPRRGAEPAPFVRMPVMGPVASCRRWGAERVKILVMGNQAGAGHTHEDKGSFVLEFAGDTFAMDPGTCDYSHPLAAMLSHCERHNMLVPYGVEERPAPQKPLMTSILPRARGDRRRFRAEADFSPGWEPYYRRWTRRWDSPAPDRLVIRDDYELIRGEGVDWFWQTRLEVVHADGRIRIRGRRGAVEIVPPPGADIRVERLPLLDGVQTRIAFRCAGRKGRLETTVRLTRVAARG